MPENEKPLVLSQSTLDEMRWCIEHPLEFDVDDPQCPEVIHLEGMEDGVHYRCNRNKGHSGTHRYNVEFSGTRVEILWFG